MYGNGTSFNGILSPDTFDHGAAQERERRERERQSRERDERVQRWMVRKLSGMTFGSVDALVRASVELIEAQEGDPMHPDDERRDTLKRCAIALFFGFVDPREYMGKIKVRRGESVTFIAPPRAA